MPDDLLATLRRAVLAALERSPNSARRRAVAETLEQLAAEQRRLAEADARVGHELRRAELAQQPHGGRAGRRVGTGSRHIRIKVRNAAGGAFVFVGRALWQELGQPERLDPQVISGEVRLGAAHGDAGYQVLTPSGGMPRLTVGAAVVELLGLEPERPYPAHVAGGAIVVERGKAG
jgi:hypothetical protein